MFGHNTYEDDRIIPMFCGGGGDSDDDDNPPPDSDDDDGSDHGDYSADSDADSSDTDEG